MSVNDIVELSGLTRRAIFKLKADIKTGEFKLISQVGSPKPSPRAQMDFETYLAEQSRGGDPRQVDLEEYLRSR